MRLAGAVLALVCCLLVIHYNSRIDRAIVAVIHPPPRSITWLVTVVYQAGSFGVVIVVVALALIARRWAMARDIALSAAGTAAVSGALVLRSPRSPRRRCPTWPGVCSVSLKSSSPWSRWPQLSGVTGCPSTSWAAWPSAGA